MPKSTLFPFPSIGEILASPMIKPLINHLNPATVITTAKGVMDELHTEMKSVATEMRMPDISELVQRILARLTEQEKTRERPLINATGILFHPEFGTPPLATEVLEQMLLSAGRGFGARCCGPEEQTVGFHYPFSYDSVVLMLQELTHAEDAVVFENPYFAKQLVVSTFGAEKETILARSEVYESRRGERLLDLLRAYGTIPVEVGTANRTTLLDYENGISDRTGLLFASSRVFANCRLALEGEEPHGWNSYSSSSLFSSTSAEEKSEEQLSPFANALVQLGEGARKESIPFLLELELASFRDLGPFSLGMVPVLSDCVARETDMVLFETSLLIGGPECGIVLGRKPLLDRIRQHPLFNAYLPHPMSIAALQKVLAIYLEKGHTEEHRIPVFQRIGTSMDNLRNRASRLTPQLAASPNVSGVFYTEGTTPLFPDECPIRIPTVQLHLFPAKEPARTFAATLLRRNPGMVVSVRTPDDAAKETASKNPPNRESAAKESEWYRPAIPQGENPFGEKGDWIVLDLRTVPAAFDPFLLDAIERETATGEET